MKQKGLEEKGGGTQFFAKNKDNYANVPCAFNNELYCMKEIIMKIQKNVEV